MQSFGGQVWDTSFALQALLAGGLTEEIGETLRKGHDFLKKSQVSVLNNADLLRVDLCPACKNLISHMALNLL